MKKQILPLMLALALLLGTFTSACACGNAEQTALPATQADTMPFTDVPGDADYASAVAWCYENNILNGTSQTTFHPAGTLTRAMLAVALYRAAGEPPVSPSTRFSDVALQAWYANAVIWADVEGLMQGYGNGLFGVNNPVSKEMLDVVIKRYQGDSPVWIGDPSLAANATRAEIAAALYQNLNKGISETLLPLSDLVVEVTSGEHTATFQLYDTVAAKEFYNQLPLELELSNFRDAQWMFYPPQKLNVKDSEAYHDGKKGELSYYAPWGDVFMLYEDFHAGDEMHRLGVGLSGIDEIAPMSGTVSIRAKAGTPQKQDDELTVREFLDVAYDNQSSAQRLDLYLP